MNLLVKKLKMPAVILLASLFFVSCEDPGKIGLNINPRGSTITTEYIEFILPSTQIQFNPRSTLNSTSLQAGIYTDPDFGIMSSKSYMWLGVQTSTPTLSSSAAYVSTSLSIQFSSIFGSEAELDEIESFDVYHLAGEMVDGTEYTRLDEIDLGSLIGNIDLLIKHREDTLNTDSLFTFTLSDEFGKIIFDKLKEDNGAFDTDTTFNAFLKGIAIIPHLTNNKIIQFNPTSFKVNLNYSEVNASQEVVDRNYTFNLGSRNFFNLNSNLNGTPLSGLQPDNNPREPLGDFRYLQAGTMIALKVDYNELFLFLDTIENVVVQKALLKMGDVPINKPGSEFPFNLTGYFTDDVNTWPALAESSTEDAILLATLQNEFTTFGTPTFPGYYSNPQTILFGSTDTLTYEATMSNYIQNLHGEGYNTDDTPLEQRGELILYVPTSPSSPESAPSHTATNYFKVHKDRIKLEIYYSVPNL
jgi:uncharacterized protein DUF4270